jgi:hypothetical protein
MIPSSHLGMKHEHDAWGVSQFLALIYQVPGINK